MRLIAYGIVLAAVIVLVWPGSKAGQAVTSVTSSLSAILRG